mmetsp:Transcript_13152/g.19241  ORF Transcript_13152/g.19241 Transcript_13152/m.19241 type:complete len:81 (+) Transcript_13152:478-720(+)
MTTSSSVERGNSVGSISSSSSSSVLIAIDLLQNNNNNRIYTEKHHHHPISTGYTPQITLYVALPMPSPTQPTLPTQRMKV